MSVMSENEEMMPTRIFLLDLHVCIGHTHTYARYPSTRLRFTRSYIYVFLLYTTLMLVSICMSSMIQSEQLNNIYNARFSNSQKHSSMTHAVNMSWSYAKNS